MKRYEEIVLKLAREGSVTYEEGAVIMAVFEFTQFALNNGGNVIKALFIKRFRKFTYDKLLVMTGQRRN